VSKVEVKEKGASTLGARNIWIDETVMRLNTDERGRYLGEFEGDDQLLIVTAAGQYLLRDPLIGLHFPDDTKLVVKHSAEMIMSVVYYDGKKQRHNVKRFDLSAPEKTVTFISDHADSELVLFSLMPDPVVHIEYDKRSSSKGKEQVKLNKLIAVKGVKAQGNRITADKVKEFRLEGPFFDPVATATATGPAPEDFDDLPGPEELGLEESPVQAMRRELVRKKRSGDGYDPGNQITLELGE